MSIQDPGNRPTGWGVAGDHERRIRALEALQPCCGNSGVSCETLQQIIEAQASLFAYWVCDELSGNLIDRGPHGIDLVPQVDGVTSNVPLYGVAGPFPPQTAVDLNLSSFQGSSSGFSIPFNGVSAWTVVAFNRSPSNADANDIIFGFRVGGPLAAQVTLYLTTVGGDNILSATRSSSSTVNVDAGEFPLSEWLSVFLRYNGTLLEIGVDGVVIGSASDSANMGAITSGFWAIGAGFDSGGGDWGNESSREWVSNVAVFSSALDNDTLVSMTTSCPTGSEAAAEGMVLTADGSGGTSYEFPTIEVLADGV